MKLITLFLFLILSTSTIAARNFSQTTSGGVSLGAYQSGYLYYLSNYIKKENGAHITTDVYTGASAGGINSLITLMETCSEDFSNPMDSTHWKFWEGIGLNSIFKEKDVKSYSIFNRPNSLPSLQALRLKWFRGLKKGCTVYLGLSVTRLKEEIVHLNENLTLAKLKENLSFKITGQGPGIPPKVENFPINHSANMALPFSKNDDLKNYDLLENILYASSAFPLAFSPVEVQYCLVKAGERSCEGKEVRDSLFVDGGIFDNTPLNFANKILKYLKKDQHYEHIVMDSSSHILTVENSDKKEALSDVDITELTYSLFSRFVNASQNYELLDFVNNNPEKLKKVLGTRNEYSLISTPLFHFFGFFETSFREFDFYLGMNDARQFIQHQLKLEDTLLKELTYRDQLKLLCLENKEHCSKVNDQKFLQLFQISLYKLYSYCDPTLLKDNEVKVFSHECNSALKGNSVPVVYNHKLKDWRKFDDEGPLSYSIRLLTALDFKFDEIINSDDRRVVLKDIKSKINHMLSIFISKQKDDFFFKRESLGKNVVDLIAYTTKKNYWFVNFGKSLEIGYKLNPSDSIFLDDFNLSLSLMYQSTFPSINSDRVEQSLIPMAGLSYQVPYLSSLAYQFSLGLKYGYQFSTGDDSGKGECQNDSRSIVECSTSVKQFYTSLMFLDKLGLTYAYQFYRNPITDSHIRDKYLFLTVYIDL